MNRYPRTSIINDPRTRVPSWIMRVVRRWGGARAYVHPVGDVIMVPLEGDSPLNDRLLMGVYTTDADTTMIAGDIEAALWELEEVAA